MNFKNDLVVSLINKHKEQIQLREVYKEFGSMVRELERDLSQVINVSKEIDFEYSPIAITINTVKLEFVLTDEETIEVLKSYTDDTGEDVTMIIESMDIQGGFLKTKYIVERKTLYELFDLFLEKSFNQLTEVV